MVEIRTSSGWINFFPPHFSDRKLMWRHGLSIKILSQESVRHELPSHDVRPRSSSQERKPSATFRIPGDFGKWVEFFCAWINECRSCCVNAGVHMLQIDLLGMARSHITAIEYVCALLSGIWRCLLVWRFPRLLLKLETKTSAIRKIPY